METGQVVVYKYGTGQTVPVGAKYLCTQVEWVQGSRWEPCPSLENPKAEERFHFKHNELVWHYYEVPVRLIPQSGAQ